MRVHIARTLQDFFMKKIQVFAICKYSSIKLKDYCKKIVKVNNFNSDELETLLTKIDPQKKYQFY